MTLEARAVAESIDTPLILYTEPVDIFISPATSSLYDASVSPIPTFEEGFKIRSAPFAVAS